MRLVQGICEREAGKIIGGGDRREIILRLTSDLSSPTYRLEHVKTSVREWLPIINQMRANGLVSCRFRPPPRQENSPSQR